jgi:hypothetical protein
MSQLTRGQLKSLIKECLVEILSEGLAAGSDKHLITPEGLRESRRPTQSAPRIPPRSNSPALNSVVFGQKTPKAPTVPSKSHPSQRNPDSIFKSQISTITADPVMSQIFADTASSTLQEQIQADSGHGRPDLMSESVADPLSDDFLSASARNWASLAFSETPKTR